MVFMHIGKTEEGIVVLPVYFEVGRKNGSCISQASGWWCLKKQLAWTCMVVNVLRSARRMKLDGYTPCGSRCAHSLCPVSISPSPDSLLRQNQPMAPSQTQHGLSSEELWSGTGSQALGMTQDSLTSCCSHSIPVMLVH